VVGNGEPKPSKRGLLVVISSPSGGGKTTVVRRLLEKGGGEFTRSVSATTRAPRPGEVNGRDYYFLSEEEFRQRIAKGDFVEFAEVHGHLYGTLREQIERELRGGKVILLAIDVQGGLSIRRAFPEDSLLIFLAPPSLEVLEQRLRGRGTDAEEEIRRRLARVPMEMEMASHYDRLVVNDVVERAAEEILQAIRARRAKEELGPAAQVEKG
jgi:guanylate kinase